MTCNYISEPCWSTCDIKLQPIPGYVEVSPYITNPSCLTKCYPAKSFVSSLLADYQNAGGICPDTWLDQKFPGLFPVSSQSCEREPDPCGGSFLKNGVCSDRTKQLLCSEQNTYQKLKNMTEQIRANCTLKQSIINTVERLTSAMCGKDLPSLVAYDSHPCFFENKKKKKNQTSRNKRKNKRNHRKKYKKGLKNKINKSETDNPIITTQCKLSATIVFEMTPIPGYWDDRQPETVICGASIGAFLIATTATAATSQASLIPLGLAPLGVAGEVGTAGMTMMTMTRGECGGPTRCVSSSGQCCGLLINISGAGIRFRCPASC